MAVTYTYNPPQEGETTVEVTFTDGTTTIERGVNAVFIDGTYDATATETRVGEVALGVEYKIIAGVVGISAEAPEEDPSE